MRACVSTLSPNKMSLTWIEVQMKFHSWHRQWMELHGCGDSNDEEDREECCLAY